MNESIEENVKMPVVTSIILVFCLLCKIIYSASIQKDFGTFYYLTRYFYGILPTVIMLHDIIIVSICYLFNIKQPIFLSTLFPFIAALTLGTIFIFTPVSTYSLLVDTGMGETSSVMISIALFFILIIYASFCIKKSACDK